MEGFEQFRLSYRRDDHDTFPPLYSANDMKAAYKAGQRAQRERDAKVCEALVVEGAKPTDRLIGYEECATAIRQQEAE